MWPSEAITDRLRTAGTKWCRSPLATGIVRAVCGSIGLLMTFVTIDAVWHLSQQLLGVLLVLWSGATVAWTVTLLVHVRRCQRVSLPKGTPRGLLRASGTLAGVLTLAAILFLVMPGWASATGRLLRPWSFVPAVGTVKIRTVAPGDIEVLAGTSLEVTADIDNPTTRPYAATLYLRRPGEPETAIPLSPDESCRRFLAVLPPVLEAVQYRVEIGDSQTRLHSVSIREKPTVAELAVTYLYPTYLGLPAETTPQDHADLEAPQFTVAELTVRASAPVVRGHVRIDGEERAGFVMDGGETVLFHLLLKENTTYTIHLFDDAGHTDPEPRVNRVRVVPDGPLAVQILEPMPESISAPGSKVPVIVRATDDHGVGLIRLEMKHGADGPVEVVNTWSKFASATQAEAKHTLILDLAHFKQDQEVFLRAVAQDRRQVNIDSTRLRFQLRPQEAASAWHQIRLIPTETKLAADLARLDQLRAAIWSILQTQIKARLTMAQVTHRKDLAEARQAAGEVRATQAQVQKAALAVAAGMGRTTDEDLLTIKRVTRKLAHRDMIEAVRQTEAVARARDLQGLVPKAVTLMATQDRIIDVLRRLLNEMRLDTADVLAELKERPGTDLPPELQDKLREFRERLQDFLTQQRKVIDATADLARTPVAGYTDRHERVIRELVAAQDHWSRFMADMHTDLSKLPESRFVNPCFLKQVLEVQTRLKLAKEALTQKATDIALPLEQFGAELAKELTTAIEKRLPDTPNRLRWSQEESLTNAMKEGLMDEPLGESGGISGMPRDSDPDRSLGDRE